MVTWSFRMPSFAGLALVWLWSAPAFAQQRAAAEAIFRSGRQAAARGDWATACERFAISNRLDPAPGTLLNLARCEEVLGRIVTAWEGYVEAMHQFSNDDPRRRIAEQRALSLEDRLPHLTVTLARPVEGAQVRQNGRVLPLPLLGIPLPVDPGPVELVLEAPGRSPSRVQVVIREGEHVTRRLDPGPLLEPGAPLETNRPNAGHELEAETARDQVDLRQSSTLEGSTATGSESLSLGGVHRGLLAGAKGPPRAPEPVPAEVVEPTDRAESVLRSPARGDATADDGKDPWAYLAVGLGSAGLVTGLFTGLHALEAKSLVAAECQGERCSQRGLEAAQRGGEAALISTVSTAAGALSLGVGLWLLLVDNGASAPHLAVQPTAQGAQLQFGGLL